MDFSSLIFDGMGSTVTAVVVYFLYVTFLDYIRTMIFSDK